MLQYACEWCKRTKRIGESWILGLAAEEIGARSSRREVAVLDSWAEQWAGHPLAVHFCSQAHKENFVRAFLGPAGMPRRPAQRRAATGAAHASSQNSRSNQPRRAGPKNDAQFSATDNLRAHGFGVRLNKEGAACHVGDQA